MATNLLSTLQAALRRDRAVIDLPDEMSRHKLAMAQAWVAYERLGQVAEALKHYLASLRQRPWQPALAKPITFAAIP